MSRGALEGLRVVELGPRIAGAYCAKLLADLGADVLKVEPRGGDALRRHGPFPDDRADPDAAGLFRYLNAGKRGAVVDLERGADAPALLELVADADLVVESLGARALEALGLGLDALAARSPRLALLRISSFGQSGPSALRPATDLVLQAASGWVASYNAPGRPPVRVGGRMPEYVSGAFAAAAALTAVECARRRDEPVEVDLSMQECLVGTLAYPMLYEPAAAPAAPAARAAAAPPFGILRCRDGWIGINILTQAHWANACKAIGAPELADRRTEVSQRPEEREAFEATLRTWLASHGAEEIAERCQALRIPAAVVETGRTIQESSQLRARAFFVDAPGGGFRQPGLPYRLSATPASLRAPAPRLGDLAPLREARWLPRPGDPLELRVGTGTELPFRGLRVLDLGTFWAGPYAGMYLASFGAEVIKVESIQRPDGFRFIGVRDQSSDGWYESGSLFQATNLGKRNLTLDLGRSEGRELLLRLAAGADVLIENFAPRVMERFGLDYAQLREARPEIIMVRMPAFGLEGPWRDHVGWALAIAQAAGISAITGTPGDDAPRNAGAFVDPAVGMHTVVAIQTALAHRRRTGEGQMIEMAQLETAACMCPEPVIDYSTRGREQQATGNRTPGRAPEGVYACDDGHVALSVRDDVDWTHLVEALGTPDWAQEPALAGAAGRAARADALDARLEAWCAPRTAADAAGALTRCGVPAAELLVPGKMYGEPQLEARRYYQTLEHALSGARRYPVWPMRFSFATEEVYAAPTPTLGQHNREILGGELGLSAGELERLSKGGVIGERWKP